MSRALGLLLILVGAAGLVSAAMGQARFEVELHRDLLLGESSGAALGGGLRLAVSSKGKIYVGDNLNRHVVVFSPEGTLLETLGRTGQGPGEFVSVTSVRIGRGDSVYVFDASSRRLTVYSPGERDSLAYTFSVNAAADAGHPMAFFVPSDPGDGFVFVLSKQSEGTIRFHRVDGEGRIDPRPILEARGPDALVRTSKLSGGGVSVSRTAPLFARGPLMGLTPSDELYYGWSEDIDLTFYDLAGGWTGVRRADIDPIPVTPRDIEYELGNASGGRRRLLRDTEYPETKPAVETVIVDDRGWVWMDRYTADPAVSEWWIAPPARDNSAIVRLPDSVKLMVVRDGFAYGVSEDDVGFPIVIRYMIEWN